MDTAQVIGISLDYGLQIVQKKKSVQQTQGGTPSAVELNFSNNNFDIGIGGICGGTGSPTILSFTNTTFTAVQKNILELYSGSWKFVDSTLYLNKTDFESNGDGITYEFISSKVLKQEITINEPSNGIVFRNGDILKIHNSDITFATALYVPSGVQIFLSGNTQIKAATNQDYQEFRWYGNLTVSAPSNVTLYKALIKYGVTGKNSFMKVEADAYMRIVESLWVVYGDGLNTIDIYGTVETDGCTLYRTYQSTASVDNTVIKLHAGSQLHCTEFFATINAKKRDIELLLEKRGPGFGTAVAALVIQGGFLNIDYDTEFNYGTQLNITGGDANFNVISGTTKSFEYGINFLGGNAVFNGNTEFYHYVTIYGGSVTFKSNVTTDNNVFTVENGGGLLLEGGLLKANVTVNDGYIGGYGKFNHDVTIHAKSEVLLNSISNPLNVAGTVIIKATAKILISANDVGCAQANVESLNLENGVVFGISFSGNALPANNSECTILTYNSFSGYIPAEPITEPTYGATLTITQDANAKEIKVQISLPPAPSPTAEPVSEPTPPDTPNTPSNGPTPTNSPNSGSKIIVGFGTVLFAFFMLLISFLN